jgi:hypothetical protein
MTTEMNQKPEALVNIINTSGLEKTKAEYILEKFQDYFKIASQWEAEAKKIVVVSADQIQEMQKARKGRLLLKGKRGDIERTRKELKEQSLREGKAIDGIANVLKSLIEPIEEYLDSQERFIELQEDKIKEDRKSIRMTELLPFGLDLTFYDLKNMSEEHYQTLLTGQKLALQQKLQLEEQEKQRVIEQHKEQERIRLENEQLKADAIEKQKVIDAEQKIFQEKVRKEREEAETKARIEREKVEKKLAAERQSKAKLEAELKAKLEAEEAEEKRIAKEKRDALKAPDKQKLLLLADSIKLYELPEVKSEEAQKIISNVRDLLDKITRYLHDQTKKM